MRDVKVSPAGGADVLDRVETRPEFEDSNPGDNFAHYAPKKKLDEGYLMGTPVMALCGKVWVPKIDPATKASVCPECKEILESLPGGDDE